MKTAIDRFIFSFTQFDATSRLEALEKLLRHLNETELNKVLHCLNYESLNAVTRLKVLKYLTNAFDTDQIEKALTIIDLKLHEPELSNHVSKNEPRDESDENNFSDSDDDIKRDPAILAVARGVRKQETNKNGIKGRGRGRGTRRRRECATSDSDSESWDTVTSGAEEIKQKTSKILMGLEGRGRGSRIPPITRRLREETRVVEKIEPQLTNPRTVHSDGKITITRHAEPRTILEEDGKIKVTRQMLNDDKELEDVEQQQKSRSVLEQNGKLTITRKITQDEASESERPCSSMSPQAPKFSRNGHETRKPVTNQQIQPQLYTLHHTTVNSSHHSMPAQEASREHSVMSPGTQWRQMTPQMRTMQQQNISSQHQQMIPSNVPHLPQHQQNISHPSQPILYHPTLNIQPDQNIHTDQYQVPRDTEYQIPGDQYQVPRDPSTDQYQVQAEAEHYPPESEEQFQMNSDQYQPTAGYYNPYLCGLLNTHKQLANSQHTNS